MNHLGTSCGLIGNFTRLIRNLTRLLKHLACLIRHLARSVGHLPRPIGHLIKEPCNIRLGASAGLIGHLAGPIPYLLVVKSGLPDSMRRCEWFQSVYHTLQHPIKSMGTNTMIMWTIPSRNHTWATVRPECQTGKALGVSNVELL